MPGAGRGYRGVLCSVQGCGGSRLTATTEYCATHYQEKVSGPRIKEWLKNARAAARKRAKG